MFITRVLLVDDEEEFTEVLSERLSTRGLNVDVSSSGPQAIAMASNKPYDAVVMDLAMPEMDGIETLKHMVKQNPDIQVILLTGRGTIEKSVDAMKSGAVEFLEKPVDINTLVDTIMKAKSTSNQLSEERTMETLSEIMKKKGW